MNQDEFKKKLKRTGLSATRFYDLLQEVSKRYEERRRQDRVFEETNAKIRARKESWILTAETTYALNRANLWEDPRRRATRSLLMSLVGKAGNDKLFFLLRQHELVFAKSS